MGVYLTIFLYSLVSSLFFPIFQSLVFLKACLSVSSPNSTDTNHCYSKEAAAKDENVHSLANFILMASSTGLCVTAFFTSRWIGKLSDSRSRKLAFLIPFTGLFISDLTILLQVVYPHLSPYYFIVSEVIYGIFGGYMSITSGAFAIISSVYKDSTERAKAIARLEGTIALGSTVGFLLSSQLKHIEYLGMAIFFLIAHAIAFLSALLIKDIKTERPIEQMEAEQKESLLFTGFRIYKNKPLATKQNLKVLYFSFAVSYFTFIGSTRILYFYLKHKFFWTNEPFGYLKAINQGATTIFAMFVYPLLKNQGVHDVSLALFGLITRSFGRAWYALAWSDWAVFQVVWFEMWSKFPATALRSLISLNVAEYERGAAFSIVAVIEAFCNLTSSWVFHSLWPLTLSFCPELSFAIMPLCISPAFVWMFFHRQSLKISETPSLAVTAPEPEAVVAKIMANDDDGDDVEVEEEEESSLQQNPTETDTLTNSSTSDQ